MRFGFKMGNQNSVLLEASCTGNLRKVQQVLETASTSDVNRKGQVKLTCKLLAVQITGFAAAFADLPVLGYPSTYQRHHLRLTCSYNSPHTLLHICAA